MEFTQAPDTAQSSFTVEGPDGPLLLGAIHLGQNAETLVAAVEGPMPAGSYTVSWIGAPVDDHSVQGRYFFSVGATR